MVQFGKKKSYVEYLYTKPSIAVLLIIVGFMGVSVFERYSIEREMSARRIEAEVEKQGLQDRQKQLSDKVEYLEGARGTEEEIRKNFDVAREGEQVVILVGEYEVITEDFQEIEAEPPWYIFWR